MIYVYESISNITYKKMYNIPIKLIGILYIIIFIIFLKKLLIVGF